METSSILAIVGFVVVILIRLFVFWSKGREKPMTEKDLQEFFALVEERQAEMEAAGETFEKVEPTEIDYSALKENDVTTEFQLQETLKFQIQLNSDRICELPHTNLEELDLAEVVLVDCELSVEHEPDEPEDSHILKCLIRLPNANDEYFQATSLIHANFFYGAFLNHSENVFLSDLTDSENDRLRNSPGFGPFETMDDGRDYFSFKIGGKKVELRTKYLGMTFSLIFGESPTDKCSLVVTDLIDAEVEDIPAFTCKISPEFVFTNDTYYCPEEEFWMQSEASCSLTFEPISD